MNPICTTAPDCCSRISRRRRACMRRLNVSLPPHVHARTQRPRRVDAHTPPKVGLRRTQFCAGRGRAPPQSGADDVKFNVTPPHSTGGAWSRALARLSVSWCMARAGCISSAWSVESLSPMQQRLLLVHDGRRGRGCFDTSQPGRGHAAATAAAAAVAAKAESGRASVLCPRVPRARLSPAFRGEFGFELLHALPFLHWAMLCGMLDRPIVCSGMESFYFFAANPRLVACPMRPQRARWCAGSLPDHELDGWTWSGGGSRSSLRYYAYPSSRWVPPPMHLWYRAQPLPPRQQTHSPPSQEQQGRQQQQGRQHQGRQQLWQRQRSQGQQIPFRGAGDVAARERTTRRVWIQNKYYPEGNGTIDNFLSTSALQRIFDRLLACNFHIVYNHPPLSLIPSPDANDVGKEVAEDIGDVQFIHHRYAAHIAAGRVIMVPKLAKAYVSHLSYNEVQLRLVSRARCFIAPQGGASYLTFYQPGLHLVSDRTGKERCPSSLFSEGEGTYWHYFTRLPGTAGESIVYNFGADEAKLEDALTQMCETEVCDDVAEDIARELSSVR